MSNTKEISIIVPCYNEEPSIALIMILVIIAKTLLFGDPVAGYPSMMCVIFLVSGVQLFCIGVIGQYLSKAYLETKRRPIYFVKETNLTADTTPNKH